ncbi:roundabout homolog 2-like isoform X2 [Tubulanus polymorphus]|uniref:roundabout homolog 2-like isoform X2 n=1 Tax=Tubulanus polymorphus TaxID=672921 RepID=UPI003DA40A52
MTIITFRWDCMLKCLLIIATEFVIIQGQRTSNGKSILPNPRIIEHPEDQYVAKNDPATLNCKAEGEPSPDITWYRNGKPVITSREHPNSHRTLVNNGQLFFYRIIHNKHTKPDVGVYYCNATNSHGSAISRNATLEIAVLREEFKVHPKDQQVALGSPAVLECRPPRGQPSPRVKWKKGGKLVMQNSRIETHENGNLAITETRKSDSGLYVCIAYNIAGERESATARLDVLEKPKFIKQPEDILVTENEDVQFQCRVSGDPDPVIVWKKEDGQIPSSRARILDDKSLKIVRVKVSDEGNYLCKAENPVGMIEAVARLTVHSHPSFITTPQDKVVGVGRTVTLRCEVTGNPPPAVFWNKEESQILMFPRQDHGRFSVTEDGTLIIERATKEDAGEYICQALSVAGSAFAKAKVEVKDVDPRPPPIIHQGPQNQTLPVNSVAMLICQSSGDPMPTIKWYKDNHLLESGNNPRITLLGSGTLQISDLQFGDTGLYTCKAASETGETTWKASLTVEAPSKASVIFHRTPEPATFPGPPSKPIITEVSETSVKLVWTPNSNQGASPVIAYVVEYFSHETGDGWRAASETIKREYFEVKNLRKDTQYLFLVRARNSHGLSLPSPVSDAVRTGGGDGSRPTLAQFDIPLVEEKLSGNVVQMREPEVISSTAIKINWNILKSHKYIEGYHIKYRPMPLAHSHHHHHHHVEYSIETVTSARATMYVLRNLKKYKWYEIRIQPFYLTVEGQLSNAVRVQTFEDVPSMPPQNIRAVKGRNQTVVLTWAPPPKEHRNGVLKGYKVYCIGNSSKNSQNTTVSETTHEHLLKNIHPDIQYKIYIAAQTRMGPGVRSEPIILESSQCPITGMTCALKYPIIATRNTSGSESQSLVQGFVKEPWFIATLIGTIGGTLWFALCVFSIWLYKKRQARRKMIKGAMTMHKVDETHHHLVDGYGRKDDQTTIPRPIAVQQPDITNILDKRMNQNMEDNMYNQNCGTLTHMKTFYNKNNAILPPVAPYATTTLVNSNNIINKQNSGSAFTPIQKGYIQQKSNSSDSCVKQDMGDSNSDNSRPNTGTGMLIMPENVYYAEHMPMDANSPISDNGSYIIDENGIPIKRKMPPQYAQPPKNPVLNFADFLPPPPEHPPPSDVGTPPDSPTHQRCESPATRFNDRNRAMQRSPISSQSRTGSYRCPQDRLPTPPRNMSENDRRSLSPKGRNWPQDYNDPRRTQSPRNYNDGTANRVQSPRNPNNYMNCENGGTCNSGPYRGYKVLPTDECPRRMSDTERGPSRGMYAAIPQHVSPEGALMDRGIQSSLPSIASECMHSPQARLECTPNGPHLCVDVGYNGRESPVSEGMPEYVGESDVEQQHRSPESSIGGDIVDGSMMASWASVTDNSNSDVPSARSSLASSSDGSFLTEADFATAVAKAAELSGLTVVGSTVTPAENQQNNKPRRQHRHRERAKRPQSPYSTDSNYSAVPPHKPYPKSQRKKQLQEQAMKYGPRRGSDQGSGSDTHRMPPMPPERNGSHPSPRELNDMNKPPSSLQQHPAHAQGDLPTYHRPNFPMNNMNMNQRMCATTGRPKKNQRNHHVGSNPNYLSDSETRTHPEEHIYDTFDPQRDPHHPYNTLDPLGDTPIV